VTGPAPEVEARGRRVEALRRGMARRRAELAGLEEGTPAALADLEATRDLDEPLPLRGRGLAGRVGVLLRKALYRLLTRGYVRPLLRQQSAFNSAASRRLAELLAAQADLRERVERLERRLARGDDAPAGE